VWSYLHGGAGENAGMLRNERGFDEILFRARRLAGAVTSTEKTLFGTRYAQPFGIAPVGMCNLVWPDSDRALASLGAEKNIPYVLSTAGTSSLEDMAKIAGDKLWFQLYVSREDHITADLLKRAADTGVRVLVFTVDVPGPGRRNMALRAGFTLGFNWNPKALADLATHPGWSFATLMNGTPALGNFKPYASSFGQNIAQVSRNGLTWDDFKRLRELWKGTFVVKGVLEAEDAQRMVREGADSIWISNHGGRQLEASPAPIDVLPSIRAVIGPSVPILIDSGLRSGEDIAKALALGADYVFMGRSFMYGAAALGKTGIRHAYDILAAEFMAALCQIGATSADALDQSFILRGPPPHEQLQRLRPSRAAE
jgi:isopentenyl diphosphate isomerase/L-lactate dehydrogenase-like FMN-dependent dehydrogenase